MNRQVVQKKQRLSPLNQHIVDVHRNQINPYGIKLFYSAGELNFAAHPIGAGHEDRTFVIFLEKFFVVIKPEHPRKAALKVHNSWPKCAGNTGIDLTNHLVVGIDTYAGLFVTDVFTHLSGVNHQTYAFDGVP